MSKNILPRGLRNNNPLNIVISPNNWKGKKPKHLNNDGTFEQFDIIEMGYRAAFIILRKYIERYLCNTLEKIIRKWAPDGKKIEDNYIKRVESLTGISRNDVVDFNDRDSMIKIVRAMAAVENGTIVRVDPIVRAYDMV